MSNAELILSLAGTAFSLFVTCTVFIFKLVRTVKSKKNALNESSLESALIPLMELAEKFSGYSGEEKKQFVLTKLNRFAIENKLDFDLDRMTEKLEELINLSKKVNFKN